MPRNRYRRNYQADGSTLAVSYNDRTERRFMFNARGISTWTPDLISTIQSWYRADNVTLTGSDVTTWQNLISGGNDLTGGTAPAYVSSVAAINNQPVLDFDTASSEYLVETSSTRAAGDHVVVVVNSQDFANDDYIFDSGTVAAGFGLRTINSTTDYFAQRAGPAASQNNPTTWDQSAGTFYVIDGYYHNTDTYMRDGFGTKKTVGLDLTPQGAGLMVGAAATPGNYGNFQIAEIIVSSGEISAADITNLTAYLNGRYGLGI